MDFDVFMGTLATILVVAFFTIGVAVGINTVKRNCHDYGKYTEKRFDMTCKVIKK